MSHSQPSPPTPHFTIACILGFHDRCPGACNDGAGCQCPHHAQDARSAR